MKICLAVGNRGIEEYIQQTVGRDVEFTTIAVHTGAVLDIIKSELADIVIIAEDLKIDRVSGNSLSVPLLIKKIRTLYLGCRVIIIAGDRPEGDEFLKAMVNMGIYDIIYGPQPHIKDAIDMIYHPRTYSYGQKLQGLTDEEVGEIEHLNDVKVFETVSVGKAKKNKKEFKAGSSNSNSNSYEPPVENRYTEPKPQVQQSQYQNTFDGVVFDYIGVMGDTNNKVLTSQDFQEVSVYQENYNTQLVQYYSEYPAPNYEISNWSGGYYTKRGKIITFTSSRQGVGTTSMALNTAYELSKSNRVLVIDGTFGKSSIFSKLGFEEKGYDFENMISDSVKNVPIWNMCSFRQNSIKPNSFRYELFPDALCFTKLSENTRQDYPFTYMDNALVLLSNHFDYIIIDSFMNDMSYFDVSAFTHSDKVVVVTTQDLYILEDIKKTVDYYKSWVDISNKMIVGVNRYANGVSPSIEDISDYFRTSECIGIKDDNKGFVETGAKGLIYLMDGKRKIMNQYLSLISLL